MRYARIFFIHFQDVLESRVRVFIWFLIPLSDVFILLLFWKGPLEGEAVLSNWTYSAIASYYVLLTIVVSSIVCHIEEDVSKTDIKNGQLVNYITKPLSYILIKFFQEVPWRILQGGYALFFAVLFFILFPSLFTVSQTFEGVLFTILIFCFAFLLSFTYKMIIGIAAFWLTDTAGLYELLEISTVIFGGLLMPLTLMPEWVAKIAYFLPFSYMTYFPVVALQGRLSTMELLQVLLIQIVWLGILGILYSFLWKKGIEKFHTVGQ